MSPSPTLAWSVGMAPYCPTHRRWPMEPRAYGSCEEVALWPSKPISSGNSLY